MLLSDTRTPYAVWIVGTNHKVTVVCRPEILGFVVLELCLHPGGNQLSRDMLHSFKIIHSFDKKF